MLTALLVFGFSMASLGIGLSIGEGVGRRKERLLRPDPQPRNTRGRFTRRSF